MKIKFLLVAVLCCGTALLLVVPALKSPRHWSLDVLNANQRVLQAWLKQNGYEAWVGKNWAAESLWNEQIPMIDVLADNEDLARLTENLHAYLADNKHMIYMGSNPYLSDLSSAWKKTRKIPVRVFLKAQPVPLDRRTTGSEGNGRLQP